MKQLLKKVAGTFGLRISSMLLAFATSIVLARFLGAKDFGTYTYAISWVTLLAIPATVGFDGLLGREVAIYATQSRWRELNRLIKWATLFSVFISTLIALIASISIWYISKDTNYQLVVVFWIAMISLPLIALRKTCKGTMRGLNKIVIGLFSEMFLGPLIFLSLIVGKAFWMPGILTTTWVISTYTIVAGITLLTSIVLRHINLPVTIRNPLPQYQLKYPLPNYQQLTWLKYAFPFMFYESINILNERVDILMLGALKGVESAGLYVPINRGAQLIVFILIAFVGPLSPTMASLHAAGKKEELQAILNKTSRLILIVSAVFTLLFLSFGSQYLLIFGPEFTQGTNALNIRCIGRFLYATVGLSPMMLSMTGNARLSAMSSFSGAILNIGLNAVLIPIYGITGAAFATTFSVLVIGTVNAIQVTRNVGLNPTIFKI